MMARTLAAVLALASPALAQSNPIEPKPPPPLPDPPFVIHYLFESPLPVILALIVAAIISLAALNSAGKPKQAKRTASILLLLAATVWGGSVIIKTQREQVLEVTDRLVADVATGSTKAVDAALAPGAAVYSDQFPQGQPKAVILDKVEAFFGPRGQFPLQDHAILESQAYIASPTLAQVQIKVRVSPREWGFPIVSWWRIELTPKGSGWEVTGLRLISSNVPLSQGGV
jgi:hypothetical protein